MTHEHIPADLRAYSQWVCHDAAKLPINPHTGTKASVADPATWGTFEQACDAAAKGRGVGIGFVFTDSDPFTGIDLDVPEGGEASAGQRRIYDAFNTYAELSPSGRGLHIIAKGRVADGGVRNSALGVEVYSSGRFFTFTGNVQRAAPIADCQPLIDTLCAEITKDRATAPGDVIDPCPAPQITDDALRERICASDRNRAYFMGEGVSDWSVAYNSVLHAACLFSSDEAQVRRVVLASPLVLNAPPKGRETRLHKAERLWATEYPAAARRGAQERQEQAVGVEHGRQNAEALLAGWNGAQGGAQVPSVDTGWFLAADFAREAVPPRDELVAGVIPMGNVSSLTGDGGTGKSTVMRQLANSVATGTAWLGMDVRSGPVIYLSAEDDRDELHRSFRNIGVTQNMGRLHLRSLAGADALLAVPRDRSGVLVPTQLFTELDTKIAETGAVAVFIDNAADAFGGNENDRAQVRQFIGMLRGLAVRHRCAVVLLSHPSVAGMASGTGSSGSTAWNNSVRSRLYLSRVIGKDGDEANPNARTLTVKKNNYGPVGQQIVLTWRDGIFVSVDIPTGEARTAKAAVVFMKLLEQFNAQGRRVNTSGGAQYAPKAFAEHPEADGVTKAAFKTAMEMLLSKGAIALVETGPASKRRSHLVAADGLPTPFQPQNGLFQPPSDPPSNPVPTPFQPLPTPLPSNPL